MFESLDDADVRTAGTTYLIYRGRHQHEVSNETALARIVTSTLFRRTIDGPQELFYADLYASRKTGCRGQLGMPGIRDQHTGCVGAYLVEHDLFDFLLFSLPDNDAWSHKNGPHAQVTSIAAADRQLERLMHAAGGPDAFLDEHAVIVTSDHSQAAVEERIRLDQRVRRVRRGDAERGAARSAPRSRSARRSARRWSTCSTTDRRERARRARRSRPSRELDGVDLVLWLSAPTATEAVVRSRRGELRFAPGGELEDERGGRWSVEGELRRARAELEDGRCRAATSTRTRSARIWSALQLPDRRRRAAVGRAGLRVRRLGRRRPRRRRQPRLAAPLGLARRAAVVRHRPGLARRRASSGRCATWRRWCASISGRRDPRSRD